MKMLQTVYAASLIDSLYHYDQFGITKAVEDSKRQSSLMQGATKAKLMGIETVDQVFLSLKELFGCANWTIQEKDSNKYALATGCMLCHLAKQRGTSQPCNMMCLDPMMGMVKGLDKDASFSVKSTLWDGDSCLIQL